MNRYWIALLAGLCIVLLAACEPQTITDEPDEQVQNEANEDAGEAEAPEDEEPAEISAGIGDSITLQGADDGLQMQVTVQKVIDVEPNNEFLTPADEHKWVGVQLKLKNIGDAVYNDAPSNGAALVDQRDRTHDSTFTDHPEEFMTLKIAAGDQRVGMIVFEVPERTKLRTFQFTLDSGFGPQTGEWDL